MPYYLNKIFYTYIIKYIKYTLKLNRMLNPLKILSRIIKSSNQKQIERLQILVNKINDLEKKISLSKFTFTHDMARLLLIEQIYRALTVIKNIPYHNY